ncbi:hypothetical protein PICMEDRAFT_70761 [Pichia membranifaciens NRRL Y-2026]|uniref:Response regulatory domain-containing protein n=1 Tax=Pichia membranifaciens NRRL Y-2026 TaxID=763406 RepID=A0A1E3NT16_9ASCO|nr:hypothetical protein PICMEDRAFT_70761 [Pichia membranifaciens NRRL Y-2026]ODQ49200.1 hypothetical protein PICMEDRAFT_70761 [Pichia membranifaciens NRRL Y-2026]
MFSLHRKKNHDGVSPKVMPYVNQQHLGSIVAPIPMSKSASAQISHLPTSSPGARSDQHSLRGASPVAYSDSQGNNNIYYGGLDTVHSATPSGVQSKKNSMEVSSQDSQLKHNQYSHLHNDKEAAEIDSILQQQTYNILPQGKRNISQSLRSAQSKTPVEKRIWVRKNSHSATTITVGPHDIVDDLKYVISSKFPTTLGRRFDPSDLVIKLIITPDTRGFMNSSPSTSVNQFSLSKKPLLHDGSHSPMTASSGYSRLMQPASSNDLLRANTPISPDSFPNQKYAATSSDSIDTPHTRTSPRVLILEPDVLVWSIVDKYFPNGMNMSDAFLVDTSKSPSEDSFKFDQRNTNQQYLARNLQTIDKYDSNISSLEMNQAGSTSASLNKTAILGDERVPPPRLRLPNSLDYGIGQTPQSSAVILFPRDVRGDNKSLPPASHPEMIPPPPSPQNLKIDRSDPPIQIGKNYHSRTNSSELQKKLNLTLNTSSTSDEVNETNEAQKLTLSDTTLGSAPNSASTITPKIHLDPIPDSSSTLKKPETKLPVIEKKPKAIEKKHGISKILSHINVLVVEDNLVNQKIMARHLKSCKVQFQIASTGKEALEMWKKGGFHLCFMDIQLPVMSGIEVTKEIRRLERLNHIGNFSGHNIDEANDYKESDDVLDLSLFRSPIIIVALTASTGASDQQNALAAGCNDYLTKPVQLKWLKNKLTEWGYMQALINYDYFRNES